MLENIDVNKVVAVVVDSDEEAGAGVLGKLVMYTISDSLRITPDELAALFDHFSIDKRFLPKEINPGGVLKSILRSKKLVALIHGKTYKVEFRI